MRLPKIAAVAMVVLAAFWAAMPLDLAAAADGDQYVGTWKGTWEGGGGGGRFDMTSFARQRRKARGLGLGRHRHGRL